MGTFLNPALFINQPIAGGTANRLLFQGSGPKLSDSANLTYDGTTLTLNSVVSIPCAGSSYASPKVFGMTSLSTGEAARWQFGDALNCIQCGQGRQIQMVGYHGVQLVGAHYQFSAWPYATDTGSCVHIPSTQASYITLLIDGKASQTADLTRWRNSGGTALAGIAADGSFYCSSNAVSIDNLGNISGLTLSVSGFVEAGAPGGGGSNISWVTIHGDEADPYLRCNNSGGVTIATISEAGYLQLYDSANDQMLELTPGDQTMQVQTAGGGACDFLVTGSIYPMTSLALSSGVHVVGNTSAGSKIGTATTQKFGFYNATPIAQRSGAAQAAVATTAATNSSPYGYSTAAQADAIVTLVNELRAWAVAQGFIKGSA